MKKTSRRSVAGRGARLHEKRDNVICYFTLMLRIICDTALMFFYKRETLFKIYLIHKTIECKHKRYCIFQFYFDKTSSLPVMNNLKLKKKSRNPQF